MKFRIIKEDIATNARLGLLQLKDYSIETPILFLGTILNGKPEPWKYFESRKIPVEVPGMIINAYEILKSETRKKNIFELGIKEYLGFSNTLFMDSGGFLIQKNQKFDISVDDVLEVYRKTSADIIVTLDHPFSPILSAEENLNNWKKTIENWEVMREIFPNIMPVIHGYTKNQLENACDIISSYEAPLVGLGSLVPLMRSIEGTKEIGVKSGFNNSDGYSTKKFVVDAVKFVRSKFPERLMHVFGIGSASTMHLMFSLGVDSLDSMGWRLKAAYGAVQLPFSADRFLSSLNGKRGKRPLLSEEEIKEFNACKCGVHNEYEYDDIDVKFEPKAIHNAYVFIMENLKAKTEINNKTYRGFVEKRLARTVFKKLFQYVMGEDDTNQTNLAEFFNDLKDESSI